jgi:opacity protein-like surface antigen
MKKIFSKKMMAVVMALAFVSAGAATTALAKDQNQYYMSGVIGFNFDTGTDVDDIDIDDGWQGSIAIGNKLSDKIRIEAEYQYLDNDDDLDVNSLMANGYYDIIKIGGFTPYLTTGIGIGWFDSDDFGSETSMVWKMGAGVDYEINKNWSAGVRYTYFDANEVDYDSNLVSAVITYNF